MSLAYVADIRQRSHDPTGTSKLRAAFRAAGKMQLRLLRAQLRTCIIDHDLLGLVGTNVGVMASAPDVKLAAFNHWLTSAANKHLHRDWAQPYVERAWQAGLAAGARDAKTMAHPHSGQVLQQLLRQELTGIVAAIVQQVGREAARNYSSPHKACRQLSECLDQVGANRIVALTNSMTVAAFNKAKVAVYRQAGFTQVGVIPERLPNLQRAASMDAYDPSEERDPQGRWVHGLSGAEVAPYVEKTFKHEPTGSHAEIVGAGRNYAPHPDAVDRGTGTGASRAQVTIKWVETPEAARRTGGGHAVMRQVTAHLDKYRIPARLSTTADLHPFYAKHGFAPAVERDGTLSRIEMVREPRPRTQDAYIAEPIEVGVRTAGDDRVCEECDDDAEGAPYDLDELEDSLPLHPNCRCTWFPWDDRRFERDTATNAHAVAPRALILPVGWVVPDQGQNAPAAVYGAKPPYARWPFNDVYNEEDHPRDIHGQWIFVGNTIEAEDLEKIGPKLGSNEGGLYKNTATGEQYYIKSLGTADHGRSEYIAADLYALAGVRTLQYHPVAYNPSKVATKWESFEQTSAHQFTAAELTKAQHDFAVHAWLANWDAVGLEHDNLGVDDKGRVVILDVGGALEYRAQGTPKGDAFGSNTPEWLTLRDPDKNPQAASIFGSMTEAQLAASAAVVGKIKPKDIRTVVKARGGSDVLADKLIERQASIVYLGNKAKEGAAQIAALEAEAKAPSAPTTKGTKPETVKGWVASKNHGQAVQRIQKKIDNPAGPSQGYRWTVTKHLEEAEYSNLPATTIAKLKAKRSESLASQAKALAAKGSTAKAELLQQQAAEIAHANSTPAPKPLPEPKPAPPEEIDLSKLEIKGGQWVAKEAPAPAPAHDPLPPPEAQTKEQKIALKTTPLPVYGAGTEAAKQAVASFNKQYAGKQITTGSELQQKIGAYAGLKAFLAKEDLVATALQQAELAKGAAKQAEQASEQQKGWVSKYGGGDPKAAIHIDTLVKLVKGSGSYGDAGIWLQHAAGDIAKGKVQGIAPSQLALVKCYTGHFFRKVNEELRHGTMTEEQHRFAHGLNEALEAMPTQHVGTTYRRVDDLSQAEAARYIPGNVVLERAFMSTAKHKVSGDYTFIVTGHSGRDVSMVSEHPSEEEVLFKYNTGFRVTAREGKTIHLQEVDY